jgi:hypothetical protein
MVSSIGIKLGALGGESQRPATTSRAPVNIRCAHATALLALEGATDKGAYWDFVLSLRSRLSVGDRSAPAGPARFSSGTASA